MEKFPLQDEIKVTATELFTTLRKLLKDTSVRRILVKNAQGRVVVDLPLAIGLVGMLLLPLWTVIALIAGSAGGFTVDVQREPGAEITPPPPTDEGRPADRAQA